MKELDESALTVKNKKVSAPGGIPAKGYKLVFRESLELLLGWLYACLNEDKFSCYWKVARLTLVSKGKGNPEKPSAC